MVRLGVMAEVMVGGAVGDVVDGGSGAGGDQEMVESGGGRS